MNNLARSSKSRRLRSLLTERDPAGLDMPSVAQEYLDLWRPEGSPFGAGIPLRYAVARLRDALIRLDEDFCREVAAYYERAPALDLNARLITGYHRMKQQTLQQYHAIIDAGIEVEPSQGEGQPYLDSRHLRESVRRTGKLYVYLTSAGHGSAAKEGFHPLREPSGIRVNDIEFCYNDLFRAVHDLFGHVMCGSDFGVRGEFLAVFCHMHMYTQEAHHPLFTEQIGQICWFYYGPHLLDRRGRLPKRGEPAYLRPRRRPYPEQKVFMFPEHFLDKFKDSFEVAARRSR